MPSNAAAEAVGVFKSGESHTKLNHVYTRVFVDQKPVMVCSVYPGMSLEVRHPSGTYIMPSFDGSKPPADPDDPKKTVPYAYLFVGAAPEEYDQGDGRKQRFITIAPRELADDLFGTRPTPDDAANNRIGGRRDFYDRGFFIPAGERPTKQELADAIERRNKWFRTKVAQGDAQYAMRKNPRDVDTDASLGCQILGLDRVWAEGTPKTECPACTQTLKASAAVCPHCNAILDRAKAAEYGLVVAAAK